ncbi:WG repeat-containing protein [Paenibacillus sp. YN15]|uniref:WG repeat-containing protein n=1 Tax=Paenibacillus sp. YN15 TaxID=1742774 RepID=UPI0015EB4ABB|nr:WG repeat-containing protein [Paenibacillus sp. YN15]
MLKFIPVIPLLFLLFTMLNGCNSSEPDVAANTKEQTPSPSVVTTANGTAVQTPTAAPTPAEIAVGCSQPVASEQTKNLFRFRQDGKWGYFQADGTTVIPPKYDYATDFSDELATVYINNKLQLINVRGDIVVERDGNKENVGPFHNGMAILSTGIWMTYMNTKGEQVLNQVTKEAALLQDFYEGMALVELFSGKSGYINVNGEWIVPPVYEKGTYFSLGMAAVKKEGKWGFIAKDGSMKIPFQYEDAASFQECLASVKDTGGFGFIDLEGRVVIPTQFEFAESFSNGLALVRQDGKYGFILPNGEIKLPITMAFATSFKEGLSFAEQNGRYGFINQDGNWVIEPQYDYSTLSEFRGGLAIVQKNGVWTYIDRSGKIVRETEALDSI